MSDATGEPDRTVRENEALRSRVTALKAEAERFKTTLQSIGDAVISVDTGGNILQMNPVAQTLTGWGEPQALGQPLARVFRIVNEETRAAVESPVERVLREGVVVGLANHTLLIAKDGSERPIADSGAPIRNEKGETTGVVLVFRDQTEERAAQRSLQESERRYRTLAESLPHLVWTCRADGPCDYLSPRWVDYTGIPEADQLGYRWLEQLHPDDRERVIAEWGEVAPRGGVFDIEFRIRRADGAHRWFKTRAIPFRDDGGRVVKWFGSNTDIDDYKRVHEALRESQKALVEAQTVARVGSWEWDAVGDKITGSQEFYRLFDVAPEALVRFTQFVERLHPDDRERVQQDVAKALHLDRPYDTDYRVKLRDGGWRDINARGQVFLDDGGKPVRMVGTCLDITKRKHAEAARRESEERNRATLYSIGDAVMATGADSRISQMNPVAEKLTGWTEAEALGKPLAEVFRIVNEETRAEVKSPVDRVLREGVVVGLANHTVLIARDGTEHPIADSGAPIRNEKGETAGVVLVFRDQTEERAAQKALKESEAFNRTIVESIPQQLFLKDRNGVYLAVNQPYAASLGCRPEQLVGKDDFAVYATELAEKYRADDRAVMESGQVKDMEERYLAQGKEYWVHTIKAPVSDDGGQVTAVLGLFEDITGRKRVEQSLKDARDRLEEAQRAAHLGNWEFEVLNDQITGSEEFYRLFDVAPEDIARFSQFVERLHPDDRERVQRDVADALKQDRPYDTDYRVRLSDGGWRDVIARGRVFVDEGGKPLRMVGTCLDITERKRAEAALRESEQRLRRFYESGLLGVIFWNMHGQITDANDKFLDMVGYTRAELKAGQIDWLNMTPPEYRHLDDASVVELKATGVNRTPLEKEYIRKDGSRIPIAVAGAMLDDERVNGVAFVQDITERRRAEQEIESLARFPRENPNPILRVRHDGKILYANPSSVDLLVEWSCAVGDFLPASLQNTITISVAGTESATVDVVCNHRVFSVLFVPIPGTDYVNLYGRDVTERVRAEEAVRLLNTELEQRVRDRTAQLEESNKELEAFSYSVSHDLRAPLRAIDGFTRILADDYAPHLDMEGQRLCSVIHENTGKMSRLIDDLLAFSRLGRAEMTFSRIDMGSMASAVFHELTTPESRTRIDFQVGALPSVVADPTLMRQVWMNLLSNAIKFSSKQKRAVVKVSARENGGESVYAVRDNGAGFDMQYVGKLFGVFQRLHSSKEFEGTGVGLALVQRVIRRHGGRVWAEGEPNKGATFYFALQPSGV